MIELKLLYFFSMIMALLRLIEFALLFPNEAFDKRRDTLSTTIEVLGIISSMGMVGFGLPQASFFFDLYCVIKVVEATARKEHAKVKLYKRRLMILKWTLVTVTIFLFLFFVGAEIDCMV